MFSDEVSEYARRYQSERKRRCAERNGIFLPLEALIDRASGVAHLSVSFSGSTSGDVYVTKEASLIRAVRINTRWLVVPYTIAKLYTQPAFLDEFSTLLEEETVEGESFWVFRKEKRPQLRALLKSLPMDQSFRQNYQHEYFPEP